MIDEREEWENAVAHAKRWLTELEGVREFDSAEWKRATALYYQWWQLASLLQSLLAAGVAKTVQTILSAPKEEWES